MDTSNYVLTIKIGDTCCRIRMLSEADYQTGRELYKGFLTDQEPDIVLDLSTFSSCSNEMLIEQMSNTVFTHENNRFYSSSDLVKGEYNLVRKYISITADKMLGNPDSEINLFNRLISLLYYSACRAKCGNDKFPAMLIHSAAIIRNGVADVYTGRSGIGKTTLCSLCRPGDGEVINDEMVLISRPDENDEIFIQGAPILGGLPVRSNKRAPLGRIFFLEQGSHAIIREVDKSSAYLKFIRQVVSPAYIGQKKGRELYLAMADFSAEIVNHVPVFELEFGLDPDNLWNTVG